MDISMLKPASDLARVYGVKAVAYGGPGSGKTPLINTAPRPVLCATEPGLLSMRGSDVPTWEAYTPEKIYEFFDWLFKSKEAAEFDTVGIDSISQLSEIILIAKLKSNRDGRKAYGEMSVEVMEIVSGLYYLRNKHVYMIAKQAHVDEGGVLKRKPYFPGNDLNIKVPHLFDEILHIDKVLVPGGEPTTAIRTCGTADITARDRSGKLDKLEPMDLNNLFEKVMS